MPVTLATQLKACMGSSCFTPGLRSWKSHTKQNRTNWTQNSHFKQCNSWGLRDWQLHPIYCMTIPLVDIWLCRVYMYCLNSVCTFMFGWPCIIFKYFVSFPTWYTFIFPFLHSQFYNFLYMFRTSWSIIRRIKLHVQPLAHFPHSLLSRAWPLVLTEWLVQ